MLWLLMSTSAYTSGVFVWTGPAQALRAPTELVHPKESVMEPPGHVNHWLYAVNGCALRVAETTHDATMTSVAPVQPFMGRAGE